MTMTFYLGKEYSKYEKKFTRIKKFIRHKLERNSNAEAFRWIIDQMFNYIKEEEKKKHGKASKK